MFSPGETGTQTLPIPVRVAAPGADAIADAANAAAGLGNTALANRLNDLSIALTNLVQGPSSDIFKSQSVASLDSVIALLGADPQLSPFATDLTAARGPLASATTAPDVQAAVNGLGNALDTLSTTLTNLAEHRFELSLSVNSQIAQPLVPVTFPLILRNTGTETTTYNFSVLGLPTDVTSAFNVPSITLAPGQATAQDVFLTLTSTSTTELNAFSFDVQATVEGVPEVRRTVTGSLTVRREVVSVVSVATNPPFVDPGENVILLGNQRFAFASRGTATDTPQLFIVDASDPNNVRIVEQRDVSSPISGLKTDGTLLCVTAADGLTIYALGGNGNIPLTAEVRIPDQAGVTVVPGSFNVAPSEVIDGAGFDTYRFDLGLTGPSPSATLTWQTTVSNLQPGESRELTLGTTVAFTSQGTPGQVTLPALEVAAEQILGLTPAAATVRPGAPAAFTLMVANPAGAGVSYALSVQGVPAGWSDLPASVTVAAGATMDVAFALTAEALATRGEYGFVITASTPTGATGSVRGVFLGGA